MTNHSETTGPSENDGIGRPDVTGAGTMHDNQVTLRTPAELADALPYLLGYGPEDSIVLVALHDRGGRGRFGGRARLGIPASRDDWEPAARQLAQGLVAGSERRGARPEQMVAYVCQEPGEDESARDVMRRLQPLAQLLRTECGRLDVPVIEALCISDGRFWSYCCPSEECCPDDGSPMGLPGTSVLAAAATYAGIQVRGSLRELRARLLPWETAAALDQEIALDTMGMSLVPRILDEASRAQVAQQTLDLAELVLGRFAAAALVTGTLPADLRDDELISHEEAAALILGLQDRTTRDRAAAWMEGDEAGPALRLWRALARRCVGPYGEHAAAPLTLAGWVAWSTGDDLEAREALAMALGADPDYLFARLLHQACNEGLDPEAIRRCLRTERTGRGEAGTGEENGSSQIERPDKQRRPDQVAGPEKDHAPDEKPAPDQQNGLNHEQAPEQTDGVETPDCSPEPGPRRRRRLRSGDGGRRRSARAERRRPQPDTSGTGRTHPGGPRPGATRTREAGKGATGRDASATGGTRSESNGAEGDA